MPYFYTQGDIKEFKKCSYSLKDKLVRKGLPNEKKTVKKKVQNNYEKELLYIREE